MIILFCEFIPVWAHIFVC